MRVRVKVKVSARRERIEEAPPGVFEIDVKEKAEANAANHRVRILIACHFHVPESAVRITAGHHRKNKTLDVLE